MNLKVPVRSNTVVRIWPLALAVILLVGCNMAGPRLEEAGIGRHALSSEFEGLLLFQMQVNGHHIAPGSPQFHGARVKRLTDDPDTATTYRIRALDGGAPGARVFVGALPVGTYEFTHFEVERVGVGPMLQPYYTMQAPEEFGSFSVLNGEVTLLGTIVVQPGLVGHSSIMGFVRAPTHRDLLVEAGRLPSIAPTGNEVLRGWDEPPDLQMMETLDGFRARSPFSVPMALVDDEHIAAPSMLGGIYFRDSEGDWRHVTTDSLARFHFLTRVRADAYLVGGDEGALYVSPSLQGAWVRLDLPEYIHAVHAVEADDQGLLAVVERRAYPSWLGSAARTRYDIIVSRRLMLARTTWPEIGDWEFIHGVRIDESAEIRQPPIFLDDAVLVSLHEEGVLRMPREEGQEIHMVRGLRSVAREGDRLLALKQSGREIQVPDDWAVSDLQAKQWRPIRGIRPQQPPILIGDESIIVFGRRIGAVGDRYPGYYLSHDGSEHWTRIGELPDDCQRGTHMAFIDETLLQMCTLGRVFAMDMHEGEWRLEKPALMGRQTDQEGRDSRTRL
jgi:hypothetical protein